MKAKVINGFTDKTLIGGHGAFREAGQIFDCSKSRFEQLKTLGFVKPVKSTPDETKESETQEETSATVQKE